MGVKIILTNGNEHLIPDVSEITDKVVEELAKLNLENMVADSLADNRTIISSIVNNDCFSTGSGNAFETAVEGIVNNNVLDSSNTSLQEAVRLIANDFCFSTTDDGSAFGDAVESIINDLEPTLISALTDNRTSNKNDVYIPAIYVLTNATLPTTGKTGDYCIIKDTEAGTQTAYMYLEDHWEALNGNYDATNIYFKNNFKITEKFGKYDPAGSTVELETAEQSLWWLLQNAFATDKNPARTSSPQISWTTKPEGTYEVGTSVTPTYEVSLTPGGYTYGPETGITAKGWTISIADTDETSKDVSESSFNTFTIIDGMSSYAKVTAKTSHDAGAIPLTLLENEYDSDGSNDIRILANDNLTNTTNGYTGYRAYFYGITNNTELTSAEAVMTHLQNHPDYLSNLVRTGTFKNNKNSGIPGSFKSGTDFTEKPKKWQQMYFLVPRKADGTSNITHKVKKLLNTTGTVDPGTVHSTTSYIKGLNDYAIPENIEGNTTNTTDGWLYDVYFITTANAADHDTWNITKGN